MSSTGYPTGSSGRDPQGRFPMGRIRRAGMAAIAAAVAANAVAWGVARAFLDISDAFVPLATVWPTAIFTGLFLAVSVGVFAGLNRFTAKPIARFWQIAFAILILTLLSPLAARAQEGATSAAILTLEALHIVAFAVFVPLFTRLVGRA